jgi:hypothetical protein
MIITSSYGIFSIVNSIKDQDQLLVRSESKEELVRIFDEKRVLQSENQKFGFYVPMCKQEFANTLIMLVKEINYGDFEKYTSDMNITSERIWA